MVKRRKEDKGKFKVPSHSRVNKMLFRVICSNISTSISTSCLLPFYDVSLIQFLRHTFYDDTYLGFIKVTVYKRLFQRG